MAVLDDYLDRVRRELQASPEEATEVLREIRSHLELALLDTQQNGASSAICLERALERFGAAEYVGRELRQVHGRATWLEAGLAVLPLFLLGWLTTMLPTPIWVMPLILAVAAVLAWRAYWPLWWWAWLGWLPLAVPDVIPGAPYELLWGAIAYAVIMVLVTRRDWLEATLATYPLPTVWAFQRVVLASSEVRNVGWSATALQLVGLAMTIVWGGLLIRTLRTPSKTARISRVLQGQVIIFLLNGLIVVAARLWPTYPFPYPYSWRHFLLASLPYAIFNGMPYLLFFVLTSLPAILALVQMRTRRRPPSRPVFGG